MRRGADQPQRVRFLGGLPAVIRRARSAALLGALALGLLACPESDKKPPTVTRERSQSILSTDASPPSAATATASAPPVKKAPRQLCAGQMGGSGRDMPKGSISRAASPGASEPPKTVEVGGGKWTWINFWAAWCVPCKEEIPRLVGWEKKLTAEKKPFRLVFVTLDDDQRQLEDFLKTQGNGGVRSTYWLKEGKEREEWMSALGIQGEPELPAHVLVDPRGKVRCIVNGAVEDDDYSQVVALVGG
jgi:thiol-disulfide isomerase/thioredoxin